MPGIWQMPGMSTQSFIKLCLRRLFGKIIPGPRQAPSIDNLFVVVAIDEDAIGHSSLVWNHFTSAQ